MACKCRNGRWLEPFPLRLYRLPSGDRNGKYYRGSTSKIVKIDPETKEGIRGWRAPVVVVATVGRNLLLAWEVSAVREEPWRRLLQELSYARGEEEYVESRRRLGVSVESVWLVPKSSGGGVAVVYLEALDPERVLGELAASEAPFDAWYGGAMRKIFGFDLAQLPRAGNSELLFTWRDDRGPGER